MAFPAAFVPEEGKLLQAWQELETLKDEGKLKSIGVSNFRPQDLKLILSAAKHKPVINQVRLEPFAFPNTIVNIILDRVSSVSARSSRACSQDSR